MSREILFKAKRVDNGEWVEGFYSKSPDPMFAFLKDFIFAPYFDEKTECGYDNGYMIDVNTLCQYTGLTDKNGNKIWENDLIECKEFSDGHLIKHFLSQVEWDDTGTGFTFKDSKHGWVFMDSLTVYECEVKGNIFDNPELLKGSEENG